MTESAFLFPGQGAQHVGMGQKLIERFPDVRKRFDQAREILGYDLAELCQNGPAEKLDATIVSQPALFVCSLAALELLKADHPGALESCTISAGLSLGEYTALTFAGAMTFEDGLRVVQCRGEAMQKAADATPSGMVSALLLDREKVEAVRATAASAGQIWVANYLCPGNTVLSGDKPACAKAAESIETAGGKPVPLAVAGAFHTPLMQSACTALGSMLQSIPLQSPKIPVVSNVDAKTHADPEEIRQLLVRQVTQPVLWEDSIRAILDRGVRKFYEIGPGKVLKGLMRRIDRKAECDTINDSD